MDYTSGSSSKPLCEIINKYKERISLLEEALERISHKGFVCCGLHEGLIREADRALENRKIDCGPKNFS